MLKSLSTKHIIVSHFAYCEISEMLQSHKWAAVYIGPPIFDSQAI